MTQGERIKEVRKSLKLTLEKFGEKIGVKKNAISAVENNRNSLSEQMAKSVCREYNVNETWLRTGEGEMFLPVNRKTKIEKLTNQLLSEESDSFKNRLVSVLADLNENEWEFLEKKAMQLCGIDEEDDINKLYSELPAGKDIEKEYPPVNSDKKDVG
ncbi:MULTISPECIES: helix-turn-helix domain-containing protein [Clostridia]|jgi:transcriptional regulator with XRE-family HTH domain|uniref:helix-turn-helix domain-containing protein n=1 Tax=Clostridia TaxID=186801 RepID=UPI0009E83719|nr:MULTISPECIES: helix-turn-helix transcriptional regulator [Clostridia]RHP24146.1 XRE family transcriptional regulator [Clostridium sp. AF34-13]RHU76946.1 XRE family transcriptional regulator [Butyribacter intestini]